MRAGVPFKKDYYEFGKECKVMADFSPMMKQYFDIKEQYPNTLLFFRLGDFYEMFFDDAKTASRELELTLTGRDCGQEERAPMCGVPFHSAENYIAKLVDKGYKVAICEQMEDPALAKGLVKRSVIRVITPGTVIEGSMLDESKNNYICSIYIDPDGEKICAAAFCDVSTGELHAAELLFNGTDDLTDTLTNELSKFSPKEILMNSEVLSLTSLGEFIRDKLGSAVECLDDEDYLDAAQAVLRQYSKGSLEEISLENCPKLVKSLAGLFRYLSRTQISGLERINVPDIYSEGRTMKLDLNARRNLELTETLRNKERKGSLLWVLDRTKTAMGKRLMRTWLLGPLLNPAMIMQRHNAVEELVNNREAADSISESLSGIFDLERIMTRIVYGSANGRDLRSLWMALTRLPDLKKALEPLTSTLIKKINSRIDTADDIRELIDAAIVEDPPFSIREGGIIKEGFSRDLDSVRNDMNGGKDLIAGIEAREKEKTGIPKLKVGYNRVFGYYIEVTNSFRSMVPDDYIRKQTLTNAERYITQELKDLENRILGAHDRSIAIEGRLYEQVRKAVSDELHRVEETAKAIAELDTLNSFAETAVKYDYVRPTINMNGRIHIKDGRHPVVEALMTSQQFVPNDTELDMNENRLAIITGPNMAGKSTYMRQTALIVIMAQTGSFVPASSAEIGIVDSVYTRVGASDDLTAGQSTFMVEMSEVADILKNAGPNSLIILDEIGRGTSTYDGMSIARAVLEYIQDTKRIGAKTLFATHYHELTEMEALLPGIKNYNIAVRKHGDDITFLRKIVRGGADDSFGIQVAKLAGVPDKVLSRAKQVLASLEEGKELKTGKKRYKNEEPVQLTMNTAEGEVLSKIKQLDINSMTPMQCMNSLFEIKAMLNND